MHILVHYSCSFSCSASSDMGKEETSSDDISSVSADQHPTKESLNNTPMSQKSSLAKASNKVSGEPEMDRLGEDLSCFQIGTSSHGHKGMKLHSEQLPFVINTQRRFS